MYKGFTLIELMLVVSILALLTGGGLVAFTGFREQRLALREAKKVVDELRLAQRRAIAGDKPAECGNFPMQGYKVSLRDSTITSTAICSGGSPVGRQVLLEGKVVDPVEVSFGVLEGGATPLTVEVCGGKYLYSVAITSAGSVSQPIESSEECPVSIALPTPTPTQGRTPTPPPDCEVQGTC